MQEMLSDPDPNARLANMEEIVRSADTTRLQLALKIVFHSDDQNMRALGVRAYIANLNELTFDIQLPPEVQRQYDDAQGDGDKMSALVKQHPYVDPLATVGLRMRLLFSKYEMTKNTGVLADPRMNAIPGSFSISGDKVTGNFSARFYGGRACSLTFRPNADMHLKGDLICEGPYFVPKLSISSEIF